jgi:hypothetical protein
MRSSPKYRVGVRACLGHKPFLAMGYPIGVHTPNLWSSRHNIALETNCENTFIFLSRGCHDGFDRRAMGYLTTKHPKHRRAVPMAMASPGAMRKRS